MALPAFAPHATEAYVIGGVGFGRRPFCWDRLVVPEAPEAAAGGTRADRPITDPMPSAQCVPLPTFCQKSNDAPKREDHHGESHADDSNKSRVRNQHPSLARPAIVYLKLVVLTHACNTSLRHADRSQF